MTNARTILLTSALLAIPATASARGLPEGVRFEGPRLSVGANGHHTCQVRGDGTVWCWGKNDFGQLGDGAGGPGLFQTSPVQVKGLGRMIAVAAGGRHTCALGADGRVRCWGDNSSGQVGDGNGGAGVKALEPVTLSVVAVSAITAGNAHTCVIRGARVHCWGRNDSGQIGTGQITDMVAGPTSANAYNPVAIAAGFEHTCAARVGGKVSCWGANTVGQLGFEGPVGRASPTEVADIDEVVALAAGNFHTCGLRADGTVKCWGSNGIGQLGRGALQFGDPPSWSPREVEELGPVVSLTGGAGHTCARKADGTARCWGANESRQLGPFIEGAQPLPRIVRSPRPTVRGLDDDKVPFPRSRVDPLDEIEELAAGANHTCAVLVDERVRCWGANRAGEIGNGQTTTPDLPDGPAFVGGISARQIAGRFEACARRSDGTVACWRGSEEPVTVAGITKTLAVASGFTHQCALRVDGTVRCWGDNREGQLGDGTFEGSGPVQVRDLTDAIAITAGGLHSCALKASGRVQCWGRGPATGNQDVPDPGPKEVVGMTNALSVTAGGAHTCALRVDGVVFCWGGNQFAQLGLPARPRSTPFGQQTSSVGVVAIAAGPSHTCQLDQVGRTSCWGGRVGGTLGDGEDSFTSSADALLITGLDDDARAVAPVCVRLFDGQARCWGRNSNGEHGDGTTSPTDVGLGASVVTPGWYNAGMRLTYGLVFLRDLAAVSTLCALRADGQPFCWGIDDVVAQPVPSFR